MPIRHSTHELEDASKRAFERLLPLKWVTRSKQPDYGVDLEVEIFNDSGEAAGLLFYVQLRATDSESLNPTLRIELDQLRYFKSLDIPTLIVRYSRVKDEFHAKWHFLINPTDAEQNQQTMTLHFSGPDLLSAESISAIGRTIAARRGLQGHPPTAPLQIKLDASSLESEDRYTIERALENVVGATRCLRPYEPGASFHIDISARAEECRIGIDLLGSLTFELKAYEKDEIALMLVYGLAALLQKLDLPTHAEAMARSALMTQEPSHSQFVALGACRALLNDPRAMVELAILNKLHESQHIEYAILCGFLMTSHANPVDSKIAAERLFFAAAAAAHANGNAGGEASAYYSLGNLARSDHSFFQSIIFYNKARKISREYEERVYYIQELAGSLYLSRKYQIAARLYSVSINIGDNHISDMRLGDSLLMAGKATVANSVFLSASENAMDSWREQTAAVYVWLSRRLSQRFGNNVPVQQKAASDKLANFESEGGWRLTDLHEIVSGVDAYCEVANFNLGTSLAGNGDFERALEHFLICTTRCTFDIEAWSNAIKCAWNMQDGELALSVMATALQFGGSDTYARFREDMVAQFDAPELVAAMDEIARELKPTWERDGFMLRAHTDDGTATFVL